jgi:hypothetical protein
MKMLRPTILCALTTFSLVPMVSSREPFDARGSQFIAFKSFSTFKKSTGLVAGETVLTSPEIHARIPWDELIASWNADMPVGAYLKVEVRAIYADRATRFYIMGLWSGDPARHPRESVPNQKDAEGDVDTDTLALQQPAERLQLRLTIGGDDRQKPRMKFISVSLLNSKATLAPLPPNCAAWGKTIEVPERSQMAYENGDALCSPTTISMLLAYWSRKLKRPGLDRDVPEVVKGVSDPKWAGTGNWVFNTAYVGSFKGMRAYTARLSDVAELEDCIASGLPVGLSVCYNRLRGKSREPSGHLVVCVGFTESGDVIVNDPGTRENVRKIFPRANLTDAWAYKKNAVYLIYPKNARLPKDRFGHWDSWTSRGRISTSR